MIEQGKRDAIRILNEQGMSKREIAKKLNVSRNTVKEIINERDKEYRKPRKDRIKIDENILKELFTRCDGWLQRVHEILTSEYKISISYSGLTNKFRKLGIGTEKDQRCFSVPDQPGLEMQNDTSDYKIIINGDITKVIGSVLYFRYSKVRYLKFYHSFNRFKMKCFFHEALLHFEHCCKQCVIDNTHLAILRGTGKNAVFVPEMIAFAKNYGFNWYAHEKGHSNRKAGNERTFWSIETNFFPGRTFSSLEDLNKQAFEWAIQIFGNRPQSKTRLIPNILFEQEKPYLRNIKYYISSPYLIHKREIDSYGYISFNANYYWIPGSSLEEVKVLEYADSIKIYRENTLLVEYKLPAFNIRNEKFKPEGVMDLPYEPKARKQTMDQEESKLRKVSDQTNTYIEFALGQNNSTRSKNIFIKKLYFLYQSLTEELFIQMIRRAHEYKISDPEIVNRIGKQIIRSEAYQMPSLTDCDNEEIESREAYIEGKLTSDADFSFYEALLNTKEKKKGE